jgi:hypothetical protein
MGRLFLSNRALKGVLRRDEHASADNEMPLNELMAASSQDSRAKTGCASHSFSEPMDTSTERSNSTCVARPQPSTKFEGTDIAARMI